MFQNPKFKYAATAILTSAISLPVLAQQTQTVVTPQQAQTPPPQHAADSALVESMGEKGLEISFPPFSNSVTGATNPVRVAMARHGFGIFVPESNKFQQNVLDAPVALADQKYNGQRATWAVGAYPVLTYNMQAFHIRGGQLIMGPGVLRTSWYPSGPEATRALQLAYYQSLFKNRIEVKFGWLQNDLEFEAFAVGGTFATGALGVYAVIPYQVGQNTTPYGTPGVNTTVHLTKHFYDKIGFQRSADPNGGATEVKRDQTGFRFAPHGDGLLTINEFGYKKNSSATDKQTWFRAGYLTNTTGFKNIISNKTETGNWATYALVDQQFTHSTAGTGRQGLYGGVTFMYAPPRYDSSTQYYEARLYDIGLFPHRPNDLSSVVLSHTSFSPDFNRVTTNANGTAYSGSNSVAATYSARLRPGITFAPGFSYTDHPARTPRLGGAFNVVGSLIFFF
ncbi:carbohydrate porin [Granulicella cerasi]|uniref:Carbohydrate porin n=1 Tax=Granulicella cerasi TaxID=741063 RepID=A0ABW1Z768_9BACT|nr:carbohydrate porin [Granulicella cerasi]